MKQTGIKTDVPLLVVCFFRIHEPNLEQVIFKKFLSFSSSNSAEQKKIRGFFYARRVSYANNYLSHLIRQLKVQSRCSSSNPTGTAIRRLTDPAELAMLVIL
jgi:hypothetical protein